MLRVDLEQTHYVCDQPHELVMHLTNADVGMYTNVVLQLNVPGELGVIGGAASIELARLAPGQTATHTMRIRPRKAGHWAITSPNFSYRDHFGRTCRINNLHLEVAVQPASGPVASSPALRLTLYTVELPLGAWALLEGQLINQSRATLRQLQLQLAGPITVHAPWHAAAPLPAGSAVAFQLSVRAGEPGQVPVRLEALGADLGGRLIRCEQLFHLRVGAGATGRGAAAPGPNAAHIQEMLRTKRRRLQILEQQAALFGISVPPHIVIEIEQIKEEIEQLEKLQGM